MLRQYFTLEKIVNEISFLKGSCLIECFTQEKNVAIMQFSTKKQAHFLQIATDNNLGCIFLRDNFARAKRNSTELFSNFFDKVLLDISLFQNDRIVQFKFENGSIYAVLFGGANSNIIAGNNNNTIIEAFKNKKKLIGAKLHFPEPNLKNFESFPAEATISEALSKSTNRLGKFYAEEFCLRYDISTDTSISNITTEELAKIKDVASSFANQIRLSNEVFIYRTETGFLLSLIALQSYSVLLAKYASANKAVERKVIEALRSNRFFGLYAKINGSLAKKRDKLSSNLAMLKETDKSNERLAKYKLWAELLASQPNTSLKSIESIILIDYDGNETEIPIDSRLTLIENSEMYYEKLKKHKAARKISEARIPLLEAELKKIEINLKQLKNIENLKDLEKFEKDLGKKDKSLPSGEHTKFREFQLAEDYVLYVGRNAANNDELTVKFAKPNDIWLHARGSAGSHCVLRMPPKTEKPPKNILQKAAQIAAYYSQARNAKYTPVAYAEKKYVRKPKGADSGSVTMARETVIMAEPKLPMDIDN